MAGGLHCGIKKTNDFDLAIVYSEEKAAVAATFSKNFVKAAPVHQSKRVVDGGWARAVVVNSGNANSVTGEQGERDAETSVPLPIDNVVEGIKQLAPAISPVGGNDAAKAMITTDTYAKSIAVAVPLSKGEITIGGMAKGSGMIAPNMATMLAFITTDAKVDSVLLWQALTSAVEVSFNSITVDGDCSTNDMVLIMANGVAEAAPINEFSADYYAFQSALEYVCLELAEMIARDGEGATTLVRIHVLGAITKEDAQTIAKSIANSLLVKTAIFGNDANWGRVIMAAGNAGIAINPNIIDITFGDITMLNAGTPQPFDEEEASKLLSQEEVDITIDLHMGTEAATVLTCDLSYDYVKINAEYRT
jgi:glutamate N-acetyltransferase/amino-acid N-acetyltransferase